MTNCINKNCVNKFRPFSALLCPKQLKKQQKQPLKIIGKESVEMHMEKLYIVMGAIITPETEPNTKAALGRCGEMEMEQDAWGPLIGI